MGIAKNGKRNEFDAIQELFEQAGVTLRKFADLADRCAETMSQAQRMGSAAREHRQPGNYQDFLSQIADETLRGMLQAAHVDRFDMGRLWLTIADRVEHTHVSFFKRGLASKLRDLYGCEFTVRIRQPKD